MIVSRPVIEANATSTNAAQFCGVWRNEEVVKALGNVLWLKLEELFLLTFHKAGTGFQ